MNKHLSFLLTGLLSVFLSVPATAQTSELNANIAYSDNNVRFTVITEGVVRLEWEPDGHFIDDPSFVAVNRRYPDALYKLKTAGKWIELTTSKMKVRYKKNSGKFTESNLQITAGKGMLPFDWKPGIRQKGNLKGTYRTLDGYNGDMQNNGNVMPIEDGLLSTDGWTLIDDSNNFLFDNSEWAWVKPRTTGGQDWYFMSYGHDFKTALKDFTIFAGKIPLPPRYAFGYWWSRYWSYSDNEIRNLVHKFHTYNIPLDVLVVDMDWHYTEPGKGGWTGYTWNKRLFPHPAKFLNFLKSNNLKITLNLHPADGVASYEEQYPAMARWMGIDPVSEETISFTASSKKTMSGWFNTVLRPMEKDGVDFWWLDWQQTLTDKDLKGLSNTWWINYAVFSDMERNRATRPMLYHRWGGLGNHRYQIGFSGDAIISWKSLDFQPYFNSTASNVLYGYWSHDLGGHMGADKIDPELLTRWTQFGMVSPIMRTHSSKSAGLNKEPWTFDSSFFEVLRNSIVQRYQMFPYIYTMARKTYDEGLSLCRPMYYDYPETAEAYTFRNEYMFGDNILVAPITAPMEGAFSTLEVWLPQGNDWYEWHTGTLLHGGQKIKRSFAIDEYPLYIKAGSILPMYHDVQNLHNDQEDIIVTVFPGKAGSFNFYEDQGNDKQYAEQYATTSLSYQREGNELTVTIDAREGSYQGMPSERQFKVKVIGSNVPSTILVNGISAEYQYDSDELALLINVPEKKCSVKKVIQITYPSEDLDLLSDGLIGKFRRIQKSVVDLKFRDANIVLNEELGTMESVNQQLNYYPLQINSNIQKFRQNYQNLPEILDRQKLSPETRKWFLESIHWENE